MTFGRFEGWIVVALAIAALTACAVRTVDDNKEAAAGDGASVGSAAPDAGSVTDAAAETSSPSASSTVPPKLAGTSWTWVTGSGAHKVAFASDGGYTSDVFLDAHPGESCGTEYATHREGKASFTGTTLTLESSLSTRTKTNSCSGEVLAKDAIDQEVATYGWRLEASPEALVLTPADGNEWRYERD